MIGCIELYLQWNLPDLTIGQRRTLGKHCVARAMCLWVHGYNFAWNTTSTRLRLDSTPRLPALEIWVVCFPIHLHIVVLNMEERARLIMCLHVLTCVLKWTIAATLNLANITTRWTLSPDYEGFRVCRMLFLFVIDFIFLKSLFESSIWFLLNFVVFFISWNSVQLDRFRVQN